MKGIIIAVLLSLVYCTSHADDEPGARLLASKNILNQIIVEDKDVTVEYAVYNIGGSAAFNVILSDTSFPEGSFEPVHGFLNVKWERVAPGTNVSHVVVLKPAKAGIFNFTSAELTYSPSEESKETVRGYTSAPGHKEIIPNKEYDRRFSPHFLDWAAFAVMTLPSLGIPFLLWFSSKSKYASKPKKN
ncbi:translocon-associated protein subunit beta-like [Lineus longissimus]|uniref:translocon-associated protein subunit beta-like n=1 Tax=Lineus longissimus TaxID=88925 RepID=UPI002B4F884D